MSREDPRWDVIEGLQQRVEQLENRMEQIHHPSKTIHMCDYCVHEVCSCGAENVRFAFELDYRVVGENGDKVIKCDGFDAK